MPPHFRTAHQDCANRRQQAESSQISADRDDAAEASDETGRDDRGKTAADGACELDAKRNARISQLGGKLRAVEFGLRAKHARVIQGEPRDDGRSKGDRGTAAYREG